MSTWWSSIRITYCEAKRWILAPIAASLHLGEDVPRFPQKRYPPGTFLQVGIDREGRRVSILLHGNCLPMIKNLVQSFPEKETIIPFDDLYSLKIKGGLFLASFKEEWGQELIDEGIKDLRPSLEERVSELRGGGL